jgi:hypothetical protein
MKFSQWILIQTLASVRLAQSAITLDLTSTGNSTWCTPGVSQLLTLPQIQSKARPRRQHGEWSNTTPATTQAMCQAICRLHIVGPFFAAIHGLLGLTKCRLVGSRGFLRIVNRLLALHGRHNIQHNHESRNTTSSWRGQQLHASKSIEEFGK